MIKSLLALTAVALLAVTSAQGQSYPSEGVTFSHGSTLKVDSTGKVEGLARYAYLGAPALASVSTIVTSTNMKVGAYTVAAQPDVPRNITVTQTAAGSTDTSGTITVVGTDIRNNPLTEVITPVAGSTVAGLNAFKTVTSVTGAGWVLNATSTSTNDTITVGIGNKIGLPYAYTDYTPSVSLAILGTAVLAAPTTGAPIPSAGFTTSYAVILPLSTVDASAGTYDGTKKLIVYTH